MALDALWAALTSEVTEVPRVQAPVYAGFTVTPAGLSEVSEETGIQGLDAAMNGDIVTPGTQPKSVRYQPQPAWELGCTLDTFDTPEKIIADHQPEPKRVFRKRGPWLTDEEQSTAKAYHCHHFRCLQCIAAGRGIRYGLRCEAGAALWLAYAASMDSMRTTPPLTGNRIQ